ncbi:MAG: hypothetical protein WAV90_19230 [Gordonia amarae]
MYVVELASAALASGWSPAGEDKDSFGDYRCASWRSPTGAQIIHVTTDRSPTRRNIVDRVVVSTTDDLGWAASKIAEWSAADGDLDGALAHLRTRGEE